MGNLTLVMVNSGNGLTLKRQLLSETAQTCLGNCSWLSCTDLQQRWVCCPIPISTPGSIQHGEREETTRACGQAPRSK